MSATAPTLASRQQVFRTWDLVQTPDSEKRKVRRFFNSFVFGGAACIGGGFVATLRKRSSQKLLLLATLGYGYLVLDLKRSTAPVITGLRIETDLKRVKITSGLVTSIERTFRIEDLQVASEDSSKTVVRGKASTGEEVQLELPGAESMASSGMKTAEPALLRAILSGRQSEVSRYRFSHA